MLSRRRTLRGLGNAMGVLVLLTGCAAQSSTSTGTSSALTNVVSEAATIINAFTLEVPSVSTVFPNILPSTQASSLTNAGKTGALDQAMALIVQLQADIKKGVVPDASGAALLQQVIAYLNQALTATAPLLTAVCSNVPQCSDVQTVYKAVVLAAPLIEMFINNVIPQTASARVLSARAAGVPSQGAPLMTPNAALATLRARFGK